MDFHVVSPQAAELVMQVIDGQLIIVPSAKRVAAPHLGPPAEARAAPHFGPPAQASLQAAADPDQPAK